MKKCNCWLGPRVPTGYGKGAPYGRLSSFAIDGIGRIHCHVELRCDKCDGEFTIANVHLHPPDQHAEDQLLYNIKKDHEKTNTQRGMYGRDWR